ncbi:hypothetical protein Poli38472_003364 [Pythium oligandrum]|uniref:Uncharacterized protein n=1 Tax=Pythium oligandrum TaxID=41045 RepID=A0A8K1C6N3_PYTOL|nr:hypothetical protein Poli38472_003364 [Pythium oligandrum]|eukprot:TMW57439.1 hypothetical protein Poli38472_003364 [Pythium oligandrum]
MADNHAIGRDTPFDYHGDRGGPTVAPRYATPCHWSPPAAVVVAETPQPPVVAAPAREAHVEQRARRDEAEVLRLQLAQERLRADLAEERTTRLQAENRLESLETSHKRVREELATLTKDYKALLGCLDREGVPIPRKKSRADGTGGADQRKT